MNNEVNKQVNLSRLELISGETTIDISTIFISFNVYEDLFSPFLTGKIIIRDTNDLINTLPLVGGETLNILFFSDNDDSNKSINSFVIYDISKDLNVETSHTNSKTFILYFCSPEMITNKTLSVSKRFNIETSSLINNIVGKMWSSDKEVSFHEVNNILDFISNFWKPTEIIKFVERCSMNNYKDFVFFETINGFNFKSISHMMNSSTVHNLYFTDSMESMYSHEHVRAKQIIKYFNEFELLNAGYFGNTYYGLTPTTYGYSKTENDFIDSTQYGTSLGKNVQHRNELSNFNNINLTYKNDEHLSPRDILMKSLLKYQMVLKLNGDSTKTIGDLINLNMREYIKHSENPTRLDGKWLITNINHEINYNGLYTQNVKVTKNSFVKFDNYERVKGVVNV